jgi:hypothetical protein
VKKNEGDALSYRQRRADYSSSSPTSYLESATELPQLLSDPTKSGYEAMTERDFSQIQRDLEETVSKLKATFDPSLKRSLLRKLRMLLREADDLFDNASTS